MSKKAPRGKQAFIPRIAERLPGPSLCQSGWLPGREARVARRQRRVTRFGPREEKPHGSIESNMESDLKIRHWMNIPSHYQDAMFRALSRLRGVDFEALFLRRIGPERIALGWAAGADPGYKIVEAGGSSRVLKALRNMHGDRIQILGGIWGEQEYAVAVIAGLLRRAPFAIVMEPSFPGPGESHVVAPRSPLIARLKTVLGSIAARAALCAFAISEPAYHELLALGFDAQRLFPFGYFVEPALENVQWSRDSRELIYAGQFIERKGLETLLEAWAQVPAREGYRLSLVGTGSQEAQLRALISRLGIASRTNIEPPVPASEIQQRIAGATLLVLPSHWDGWGVVVNEAYSVGVPVVVSDRAGARELVVHSGAGMVFRAGDSNALANVLRRAIQSPHLVREWAERALLYRQHITPSRVAAYFADCIRHALRVSRVSPDPPWRTQPPS